MEKRKIELLIIHAVFFVIIFISAFLFGRCSKRLIVHTNFEDLSIKEEVINHKYDFMPIEISNYICVLSKELKLDSDLVVAILLQENPIFDVEAINKNQNGTMDCGLFQLNDKYIWTDFVPDYWVDIDIEFNPFNWKHNTFLAMHHIRFLLDKVKVLDDSIMAYNCGIGAVMKNNIPDITKVYLSRVKTNYSLLQNKDIK
jgi:hypothetical protein